MSIKIGDKVTVNINSAQMTLLHNAEVLHIPCATGDSWGFKDTRTGDEVWTCEGITIHKTNLKYNPVEKKS